MNTNNQENLATLTELVVILDRSGSMQSIATDAIGGFNAFVQTQAREPGNAHLSLILFDDQYDTPLKSIPINEVPPLTEHTYVPRGTTALLDAIGRTLQKMTISFASRRPEQRPARAIIAILSDGQENASQIYSQAHIADLIAEKRSQGWEFIFLAANQDAIATAARYHIPREDAVTFQATPAGTQHVMHEMSDRVRQKRQK